MIEIEFRKRITLEKDSTSPDEYEQFFITSEGRIFETDDTGDEMNVGTLTAVLIDALHAVQAGQNLWEAADAFDGEIENLTTVFFDGHGQINVDILRDANTLLSLPNLLYIRNIEIEPRYRGRGIALAAIRRAIDLLSVGCELVVLKPFPLQFVGQKNATNKQQVAEAIGKLRRYYRQLGFKYVKRTGFMALDLTYRLKDTLLESAWDMEGGPS